MPGQLRSRTRASTICVRLTAPSRPGRWIIICRQRPFRMIRISSHTWDAALAVRCLFVRQTPTSPSTQAIYPTIFNHHQPARLIRRPTYFTKDDPIYYRERLWKRFPKPFLLCRRWRVLENNIVSETVSNRLGPNLNEPHRGNKRFTGGIPHPGHRAKDQGGRQRIELERATGGDVRVFGAKRRGKDHHDERVAGLRQRDERVGLSVRHGRA